MRARACSQAKCWKNAYSSAKIASAPSGPRPTRANLQSGPDFGGVIVMSAAATTGSIGLGCGELMCPAVAAIGSPSFYWRSVSTGCADLLVRLAAVHVPQRLKRAAARRAPRSEEHTSELQSHSFISYA